MSKEKLVKERYNEESVDLTFPPMDDVQGWKELGRIAKEFAKDHTQSGDTSPLLFTFGEDFVTNPLQYFNERVRRIQYLHDAGLREKNHVILENEARIARNALNDIPHIDHEMIEATREALECLSPKVKNRQNEVFTKVLERDLDKNQFILQAVRPDISVRTASGSNRRTALCDFVGRLTEKDETGSPVLSDLTFKNFFEWYQANLAKRQKELSAEFLGSAQDYSKYAKMVIADGRLPECFNENLTMLDPDSENALNFNFYIFDFSSFLQDIGGAYTEFKLNSRSAPIGVRADFAFDEEPDYGIIWHEMTHAISGDRMTFYNSEAERIFNEAMTEHIANLVIIGDGTDLWEPEEYAFMSGYTYENERATLLELANSGAIKIDPILFYEAYAEWDHEFEAKEREIEASSDPLARMEMGAQPRIGPKKRALYDALFAAFPECKIRADLGKLIVDKFNNYRSARRLKK